MKRNTAEDDFDQDEGSEADREAIGDPNRSLTAESKTRHANLAEDQDAGDHEDDNLSDLYASMGVEERLDELGM
jgi:hypothetical protein